MNKKRFLFTVLLLLCVSSFAHAFGVKDNTVQVTGIVRLVGSANFPEIVISGAEEWYVVREEQHKLHDLQHITVTVEGIETVAELRFANGQPAGIRRELRKVKIISVEL